MSMLEGVFDRPLLLGMSQEVYSDRTLIPSVPSYSVNEDFSNVVYDENFSYLFEENSEYYEGLKEGLIRDGFVVYGSSNDEFFDVYEGNRYSFFPSFVTVDSLMHTYHIYFSYLMKNVEKKYLKDALEDLSTALLEEAEDQYEELKGTKWEKAAYRNLAFLYVGALLFDDTEKAPLKDEKLRENALEEVKRIYAAQGIDDSLITGNKEDYSQYKVRGYYAGEKDLENYFRAMMWYGRTAFDLRDEDMVRSAMLMGCAVDRAGKDAWSAIYDVTSFFAGVSDDPGYYEISKVMTEVFGAVPEVSVLLSDEEAADKVTKALGSLTPPAVNSVPVADGEEPVIPSFRLMGQRFTIDAAIMQKLVYSAVKEASDGSRRMLPDTLDVAAALGSGSAEKLLEEKGDFEYEGFEENLKEVREHFDNDDPQLWNASLYAAWLNTLRPLLEEKGEGYPSYKQSEKWARKSLETFAGSYAELKHDTVLYAKQVMSEMGDGEIERIPDDRGYVDPEPEVYSRFVFLAKKTREGLESHGMLSKNAKKDLELLEEMAGRLLAISEKELKNQPLDDGEYDFIREYGGNLEHFWQEANKDSIGESLNYSYQAPCPVIADIATDPNGTVLEVGTGPADTVYVVFPIDGELHVGRGSVFGFYQFEQPMSDRLTDEEWRNILADGYFDDDFNWVSSPDKPERPQWTADYRIESR